MQLRQLGNSTLMVSPIAVGFWGIVGGDYWGPQDVDDTLDAVSCALDVGINFFDTAEVYGGGYSEQMLGRALKGRRDEAIIASKVSQKQPGAERYPRCLRAQPQAPGHRLYRSVSGTLAQPRHPLCRHAG